MTKTVRTLPELPHRTWKELTYEEKVARVSFTIVTIVLWGFVLMLLAGLAWWAFGLLFL